VADDEGFGPAATPPPTYAALRPPPPPRGRGEGGARVDPADAGEDNSGLSPSTPFIRRPVATSLLMVAIFLAGLVSFRLLPLSALPQVDYPTIQVTTYYPGASPDVMATNVTAPLEVQFGQMSNLARMSSTSASGASVITLQFNLSLPLDVAEQEVQAAINAGQNLLPADLPAPPVYAKVNPADAPILTLALTSKTLPLTEVQQIAYNRLAQKISQLPGVGLVTLAGGQRPAVRIQANQPALTAYGLSLETLRSAIGGANANGAKGTLDGPARSYTIDANDQLLTIDQYRDLIVAYRNGSPVRLRDVALTVNGAENSVLGASVGAVPAIVLNVQRQPGANVVATVDAIKAELPDLQSSIPPAIDVAVLSDRTTSIRASVSDAEFELVLAVVLVVLVIFLFLGSVQATLIAGLAVPLSIVGTFAAMHLIGSSLNNLTLMALVIASGFVVDDAIVMIENIERLIEEGIKPFDAALAGARQIGFTIVSLTVSLIAVLIPLLFMGDVVGRLFREFAITLAVTIVISAVVALTMVPMLSARWLKSHKSESRVARASRRTFERVQARYDRALTWVLARRTLTLLTFALTLAVTAALYVFIPKGLFPTQDTGLLQGIVTADQSVSFGQIGVQVTALDRALMADADVAAISSYTGVDGSNATLNSARVLIALKPKAQRSGNQAAIMTRLRARAAGVAGLTLSVQPVQDLTIDATQGRAQYQMALQGVSGAELGTQAVRLVDAMNRLPEVRNASSTVQNGGLALFVDVDRDSAARLGVTAQAVDDALYDAFGQRIISTIFTQTSQSRVILESGKTLNGPESLRNLYLTSSSGQPIPLSAFASVRQGTAPLSVEHVGQFPAVGISFDTAPGGSLGAAVAAIRAAEARLNIPSSVQTSFLGAADAFQSSLSGTLWLLLAAIVVVYIVLGVLYESFVHPLTILSTLPSAGVGALLALWIAGEDLGIIGVIGIVLLIGIVKKNAIMMIDFALEAERHEGLGAVQAIHQAALLRFRPILMTTLAAIGGALPLMLGAGEGAELRRPLGLAIVGGLLLSQLLTLFTTPVIYIAFDNLAARFGRKPGAAGGDRPVAVPGAVPAE